MKEYLDLMRDVLDHGTPKKDRTGTGTLSVFGRQLRFELDCSFPLVTTRRIPFRIVAAELSWFLRGSTNVKSLYGQDVHIWDDWAGADGELGPIYGYQWRSWPAPDGRYIDQMAAVIDSILKDPGSRRHIVSAWNVADLPQMALPPCHVMFQFYVADYHLSCQVYQRSADIFLGLPFNIASYALLTNLVAAQCGLLPGDLVFSIGDAHLYTNHLDQARTQLAREPRLPPDLVVPGEYGGDWTQFDPAGCELVGYFPHPSIRAEVSV